MHPLLVLYVDADNRRALDLVEDLFPGYKVDSLYHFHFTWSAMTPGLSWYLGMIGTFIPQPSFS